MRDRAEISRERKNTLPYSADKWKGVRFKKSNPSTCAPALIKISMTSEALYLAAKCNGVCSSPRVFAWTFAEEENESLSRG